MAIEEARVIRADAAHVATTLDQLDETASGAENAAQAESRAADRFPYRIRTLTVEFADASGGWIRYIVPTRNISRTGLSVLTNQYIYPNTRCRVQLLSLYNHQQTVVAAVARCRYLPGTCRLHEVGLRFEKPVDIELFHPGAGHCKLLLCDDDPAIHQIVPRLLNQMNAHITSVKSGQEAITAALAESFDVILLDVDMPEMNGITAVGELRSRGYSRPIVALTTHSDPETLKKCLEAGYTQVGAKPFSRESLGAVVKSLLCEPVVSTLVHDRSMASLIDTFVGSLPDVIGQIETAFVKQELATVETTARQIKGTAGTHGFDLISVAAGELEDALRAKKDVAEQRDRLSQLSRLCHAARPATFCEDEPSGQEQKKGKNSRGHARASQPPPSSATR